ncbi:3-isopropylmalate dehydratase large subunit [Trifolium medium]|uniref:3-isopropylmalate dehydratase large subunit n=1 Tax=Trifolium medium TaxID=97028 RepID=A0A392NPT6_9FABA|nr:3-isopropylmalate dehydratase large subunit [Trifolium medium]
MHDSFSEDLTPFWPDRILSNYTLHEPKYIEQQTPESNDSGVWVSKWMTECPFRSDYANIITNTASRMKLAINLVKSGNNVLNEDVLAKAAQHWKDEDEKRDHYRVKW